VENFRREKKARRERKGGGRNILLCRAAQLRSSIRFFSPFHIPAYFRISPEPRLLLIFFFEQRYPAWRWTSATRTRPASTRNRWQSACAIQDTRATEQRAVPSVLPLSLLSFFINFCFASYEARLERDFLSSILRSRSVFTATHTYRLLCIRRISI